MAECAGLRRAQALLRQGVPAATVASEVGFYDQSHLARCFKRVCNMTPGQYQAGHSLLTALLFTQGYGSLAVLDISDPLAPSLVCTVNNSPYPVQPIQWLSRSEFVLVLSQPNRLLDVDVARRSITTP